MFNQFNFFNNLSNELLQEIYAHIPASELATTCRRISLRHSSAATIALFRRRDSNAVYYQYKLLRYWSAKPPEWITPDIARCLYFSLQNPRVDFKHRVTGLLLIARSLNTEQETAKITLDESRQILCLLIEGELDLSFVSDSFNALYIERLSSQVIAKYTSLTISEMERHLYGSLQLACLIQKYYTPVQKKEIIQHIIIGLTRETGYTPNLFLLFKAVIEFALSEEPADKSSALIAQDIIKHILNYGIVGYVDHSLQVKIRTKTLKKPNIADAFCIPNLLTTVMNNLSNANSQISLTAFLFLLVLFARCNEEQRTFIIKEIIQHKSKINLPLINTVKSTPQAGLVIDVLIRQLIRAKTGSEIFSAIHYLAELSHDINNNQKEKIQRYLRKLIDLIIAGNTIDNQDTFDVISQVHKMAALYDWSSEPRYYNSVLNSLDSGQPERAIRLLIISSANMANEKAKQVLTKIEPMLKGPELTFTLCMLLSQHTHAKIKTRICEAVLKHITDLKRLPNNIANAIDFFSWSQKRKLIELISNNPQLTSSAVNLLCKLLSEQPWDIRKTAIKAFLEKHNGHDIRQQRAVTLPLLKAGLINITDIQSDRLLNPVEKIIFGTDIKALENQVLRAIEAAETEPEPSKPRVP
ncbi:hypothetical protein ACFORL_01855 [Legionella dresdenensis]|uniref:F-box domain-containing protein n=1 Tax=Legionella dresdenensis TaxID=450200 RepID=A0ABV8CC73_9GAMM